MSQIIVSTAGGGAGTVVTLTGNTGGAVSPNGAGNIDILGGAGTGITVAGTPASNLLTIDFSGATYEVTTINATPAAIFTYTLADLNAVTISAQVVAAYADYSQGFGGTYETVATRNDAVIAGAKIKANNDLTFGSFPGGSGIAFGESGNDIVFTVTGVAATTINWKVIITYVLQDA